MKNATKISAPAVLVFCLATAFSGQARADCFDCLVRAADEPASVAAPSRALAGDLVACMPQGWVFGQKETAPEYAVVRICNLSGEDARFLTAPAKDSEGALTAPHRFALDLGDPAVSGGTPVDGQTAAVCIDRVDSSRKTAAEAALAARPVEDPSALTPGGGQ